MKQDIQPFSLTKATEQILEMIDKKRVLQGSAAPVLLGISGIDCSGKSTLAEALLEQAVEAGLRARLVHVDDFIIPESARKRVGPDHVDYFEYTFDHALFASSIKAAAADANTDLVIGEGIFLFRQEMVDTWDLKVWIEMSTENSLERGSVRDAEFFGSRAQAATEYQRSFIPAHGLHLNRDRPSEAADIVLEVR